MHERLAIQKLVTYMYYVLDKLATTKMHDKTHFYQDPALGETLQ